jgi:hypothetical protein
MKELIKELIITGHSLASIQSICNISFRKPITASTPQL